MKSYIDKYGHVTDIEPENEDRIWVGEYEVSHFHNGNYWIKHFSGEGTEVKKEVLEKLIADFYKETF